MTYFDQAQNSHFLPYIVETSGGVDRATLFFLTDAYTEDKERIYLKLHPKLAPYKAAVFPLLANKPELVKKAKEVYEMLTKEENLLPIAWDDRGNIGKRYLAQDEVGTPFCITVDFDTLEDGAVTIRDRDTAKQERVKISSLNDLISKKLS